MKGGLASRNIVLKVGDYHKSFTSSVSGTVRSTHGNIECSRVETAPVIEHQVDIVEIQEIISFPQAQDREFPIEWIVLEIQRSFRRGEKHRFVFDQTTKGFPLNFSTGTKRTPNL